MRSFFESPMQDLRAWVFYTLACSWQVLDAYVFLSFSDPQVSGLDPC